MIKTYVPVVDGMSHDLEEGALLLAFERTFVNALSREPTYQTGTLLCVHLHDYAEFVV